MNVKLVSDGRVFDGESAVYEPGDVAWFEEDVLLVIEIRNGIARAVEHPAALQMIAAMLDSEKHGRPVFEDAMRIHAKTMAQMVVLAAKRAPFWPVIVQAVGTNVSIGTTLAPACDSCGTSFQRGVSGRVFRNIPGTTQSMTICMDCSSRYPLGTVPPNAPPSGPCLIDAIRILREVLESGEFTFSSKVESALNDVERATRSSPPAR